MSIMAGRPAPEYALSDRFERRSGRVALTGVQALVRLLIDQRHADLRRGWRTAGLVSGYRGSPLAGLDKALEEQARVLSALDVRFIPAVNEELAATVVYGSQAAPQLPGSRFDGVFGLWYGKAPGVDRSADAFKHGTWMGTTERGGVLTVAGDDPACKSSSLPSSSLLALAEAHMPVLVPGSVADVLRLGRYGFEMSRFSGAWVGFQMVTNLADGFDIIELGSGPDIVTPEDHRWNGRPWRPGRRPGVGIPEAIALEAEVLEGRLAAARAFAAANRLDVLEGATGNTGPASGAAPARLGLVAAGRTHRELREALDRLGLDEAALQRRGIRILRLALVHPLDAAGLRSFARGLDDIVVVEEKRSFIEAQIKELLYDQNVRPRVHGKSSPDGKPLIPVDGELDADRIIKALAPFLADRIGRDHLDLRDPALRPPAPRRLTLTPVARTPFFCSGCPHNRSTVVPEGSTAGAGIGCHTMTTFMDRSEGFSQMGGEGAAWVGTAPFTETPHMFQNLGDGTFFHSGSLAIRQAVAAGTNITFKLLHNSAVAMTGGQSADGAADPAAITRMLHAEGVARIVVVSENPRRYKRRAGWAPGVQVRHRDELDAIQRKLREVRGVTVLIYDQACAAETRRKRKRGEVPQAPHRVVINEAVCEGCGDCGRVSNCLSVEPVETEFGRKRRIDQASCNADYSCLLGDCPSFVTVVPGRQTTQRRTEPPTDLPEPERRPSPDTDIVMVGIGGTGVVTTNQILATAALLDGLAAHGLDQTGLSQKAGAVVSHLRIRDSATDRPGLIGAGHADLYLAFDALAAASDAPLARCASHTIAVVSSSEVPTGRMIADPAAQHPGSGPLLTRIADHTNAERMIVLDALALANQVNGNSAAASFLIVGAAYQAGLLPLSATAIEHAIELNGTGVTATIRAFRAGRAALCTSSTAPADAPAPVTPAPHPLLEGRALHGELRRLLEVRVPELVAYQNKRYAEQYLATVTRAAAVDEQFAEAVARYLFKLMAYKDEYEVARLHLTMDLSAHGEGAKAKVLLHPPLLRSLGLRRKLALGRSARPLFRTLTAMRRLRGTWLDPFGHTLVRRTERALITEYLDAINRVIAASEAGACDVATAVEIASLPDKVRGYEQIKLDSIPEYRQRMAECLAALGSLPIPAPRGSDAVKR
jgi:indolepyruvate ferredoxin oxidoreductase